MLLRTDRATRACDRTDGGQIVFGLPDSVVHARRPEFEVAAALRPRGLDYTSAPLNLLSTVGGTLGVGGIDVNSPRHGCGGVASPCASATSRISPCMP